MGRRPKTLLLSALFTLLTTLVVFGPGSGTALADGNAVVSGAGSTWSQVAVDAWRVDMRKNGIVINYAGTGSSDGRAQFRYGTVDFGISEIPFQAHPEDGSAPEVSKRPFAYLPIVAGGTSFMYHLNVGGKLITDLRLSGETLTKIFTGVITDWSDPQITKDYGRQLPHKPIVPVVRSDGSGTSAQFSLYMATEQSSLWNAFCVKYAGGHPPCGLTSFYPQFPGSKAQSGSNGVANYVAASYGDGAIAYVEYAYAQNLHYPVAKVLNAAGYYTLPTAPNVAVALTKATINPDLTQNLTGVYQNADRRTYPLSSYSYMIVPTTTDAPFSTDKGKTLSTFVSYFLCSGQQKAAVLGYSPLPQNLVQAGFKQMLRIPGHVDPPADLGSCGNPTFQGNRNVLLDTAPYPAGCDKAGATPCGQQAVVTNPGTSTGTSGNSGSTGGTGSTTTGTGTSAGSTTTGGTATKGTQKPATVDPVTGRAATSGTAADQTAATTADQTVATGASANVVEVASSRSQSGAGLYAIAGILLLLAIVAPPFFSVFLKRRLRTRQAGDHNEV